MIRDTELRRRLFHDSGQRRVMQVADLRKQVVFNLKVQSTSEP